MVEKIDYKTAKEYFSKSSRAIKDSFTDSIKAEVEDKMLTIVASRNAYTISPIDNWDSDIVFNPNSDAYAKDTAFILDTKNLDFAIKQNSKDEKESKLIETEFVEEIQQEHQLNPNPKVNFTLKISLNDGFDDKVKDFLDKSGITNNVLSEDKSIFALQTLHEADELILKKAISRNEMPKSSIRLEMLTSNGEKIELPKVDMGRYLFKNADLNKIINVSSSKIVENEISDDTQKAFANLMARDKNGKFKTNINLDNVLENGIKGLEGIVDSIGDEHLSSFVKNFATAYSILSHKQEKQDEKSLTSDETLSNNKEKTYETEDKRLITKEPIEKEPGTEDKRASRAKIPDAAIEAIKSEASKEISKIKKTTTKEKFISKPTDIGRGM